MRGVSGVSKGGTAAGTRAKGAGRFAGGFSVGGPGAAASPGAASEAAGAATPVAAAGLSLLAAQENGDRAGRDAAARRRAASILDELRGLQTELLGGRPDPARMARLAALGTGEEGTDSGLREAVRAIALRARIELARRPPDPGTDRTETVR